MPVFTVEAPDGRKIDVEAGDQATAVRGAQEWVAKNPKGSKPPTAGGVAKSFVGGINKALTAAPALIEDASDIGANMGLQLFGAVTGQKAPSIRAPRAPGHMGGEELNALRQAATGRDYQPQNEVEESAQRVGGFVPNALLPGSLPARAFNALAPAAMSEVAGAAVRARGGSPEQAGAARAVGAVAGGLATGVRFKGRPPGARNKAAEAVTRRQDPAAMQAKADAYRASSVEPALVDIVDDSGRGLVRAAASKMTPGRQAATDFRDARAMDLPSRMSSQARRVMSNDGRTPDQIRAETAAQRKAKADEAFGHVRDQKVGTPPQVSEALQTEEGLSVIKDAARIARNSINPADRALATELTGLADSSVKQFPNMTVGAAQQVSKVLYDRAEVAYRAGRNFEGSRIKELADAIRDNARGQSPLYGQALKDYAADSRLMEAADLGEGLMVRNTDEFAAAAGGLSGDERSLALAAGRRAIERKSGENPSAAPGVARALADAPEQQARNAALMGQGRATQLQDAMRLEERAVRNANDIAPRSGSQSTPRAADLAQAAVDVGRTVRKGVTGDWLGIAGDWLKSRGMSDKMAEEIVRLSTDPARLNEALSIIRRTQGPQAAIEFQRLRLAGVTGAALLTTGASSGSEADTPDRPEPR